MLHLLGTLSPQTPQHGVSLGVAAASTRAHCAPEHEMLMLDMFRQPPASQRQETGAIVLRWTG